MKFFPLLEGITMRAMILGGMTLAPFFSYAADVGYTPMVSLPGIPSGPITFAQYGPAIYKLLIGVAIILAVVMIVIGGVKLIASPANESLNKEGKHDIWGALTGLIIIALSWIVLTIINPSLTTISLTFTPAPAVTSAPEEGTVAGTAGAAPTAQAGQAWFDDSQWRNQLTGISGVSINSGNCKTIGQKGCTSVYQLGDSAISGVRNLASGCNCSPVITGGTEYWLHSSHGPGKAIVDIRDSSQLNTYLTGNSASPANGTRVSKGGGSYTYETLGANTNNNGAHWHVVY
ncbi:MAG: hypothetical protein A2675_00050 [Candidatus Yonathbacteria bacterium RIFCSPHIGHO2_01_FULL_51_10]|uniref:Peptidase M23 domain-containing protein n=1 Tax=Candidatus Yonathbacteria bacterium RIFCSPHIGHO2_01_FULL_51_10 TaxID=1802723 RepID=A0A1G2S8T3_9BACT|nr:MAG: hypothetical protein A2675_00050 [Candidatus Yonathbacteria bacterium RIFCSPHIGHO2_01_FULL_51_10]